MYQNGCFQSRDEIPWEKNILRHLWEPLLEVIPPNVILDGELYVHGWSLQRINGAVTPVRKSEREDTALVEYHVFDVVDFHKPFNDRHQTEDYAGRFHNAQMGWAVPNKVYWVETCHCYSEEAANELYCSYVRSGYEGMMYRLGDCPYTVPKQPKANHPIDVAYTEWSKSRFLSDKNNRCWHLLKRKDWQDDEFDFVSLRETVGEKGEPGFQMQLKTKEGKFFNVGSGLTRSELAHYILNPPRQVKVKYLTLSDGGIPQNPTVLAML